MLKHHREHHKNEIDLYGTYYRWIDETIKFNKIAVDSLLWLLEESRWHAEQFRERVIDCEQPVLALGLPLPWEEIMGDLEFGAKMIQEDEATFNWMQKHLGLDHSLPEMLDWLDMTWTTLGSNYWVAFHDGMHEMVRATEGHDGWPVNGTS